MSSSGSGRDVVDVQLVDAALDEHPELQPPSFKSLQAQARQQVELERDAGP